MTEPAVLTTANDLKGGDWVMAVVSFFLTPLVPLMLSIYNFARSRRSQGWLYLGVVGVKVAFSAIMFMMR